MSDFLLIHGSCHGAWCWRDVIPALQALGHTARAIDLPSHGADKTPLADVTLENCGQAVRDAISGPTVLVGHSWGGYPITAAAELDPTHITRLVYLCAYTPWDGMSLADMRRQADRQPVLGAVEKSEDGISYTVKPDQQRALFYHDCPDDAVAFARANLCPQAIKPQETPLTVTDRSAQIPRSYIRCSNDQTIPPEFQTVMAGRFAPEDRHEMPTSHSPFFADPNGLAALLDRIVA